MKTDTLSEFHGIFLETIDITRNNWEKKLPLIHAYFHMVATTHQYFQDPFEIHVVLSNRMIYYWHLISVQLIYIFNIQHLNKSEFSKSQFQITVTCQSLPPRVHVYNKKCTYSMWATTAFRHVTLLMQHYSITMAHC